MTKLMRFMLRNLPLVSRDILCLYPHILVTYLIWDHVSYCVKLQWAYAVLLQASIHIQVDMSTCAVLIIFHSGLHEVTLSTNDLLINISYFDFIKLKCIVVYLQSDA